MVLAKVCNTTITFPNKIEVKSYSFVLSLCFLAITLVTFVQICRIKYHRHSLFHYQFGFLLYCLIWSLIQFFFWFLIPWDDIIELVLAGVGLVLQFQTFSLLALFYAQIVYKSKNIWPDYKRLAIIAHLLVNFLFFLTFVLTVSMNCFFHYKEAFKIVHEIFLSLMYMFLSILLFYYGYQVMNIIAQIRVTMLADKQKHIFLTTVLSLIFFSRGVKELLSSFNIGLEIISPTKQSIQMQVLIFFLYIFWDIVPCLLVIIIFWDIPATGSVPVKDALNIQDGPSEATSILAMPVSGPEEIESKASRKATSLIDMSPSSFNRFVKKPNLSFSDFSENSVQSVTFSGYNTRLHNNSFHGLSPVSTPLSASSSKRTRQIETFF